MTASVDDILARAPRMTLGGQTITACLGYNLRKTIQEEGLIQAFLGVPDRPLIVEVTGSEPTHLVLLNASRDAMEEFVALGRRDFEKQLRVAKVDLILAKAALKVAPHLVSSDASERIGQRIRGMESKLHTYGAEILSPDMAVIYLEAACCVSLPDET